MAANKPRILITGASGFIGSHLSRYLRERGFELHALTKSGDRPLPAGVQQHVVELTNAPRLREVLREVAADYVIHLAGRSVPGRDFSEFNRQYENTVLPTLNLALELPASTKLTLFCGSCEEYGNGPTPFREENCPVAFSPYGWGKISSFYGATMIARQRGLNWCWLRPFLTFGPGQESDLLVPSLIRACLQDSELALSPGEQSRDFIYVEDLCRMFEAILANPSAARGEVINLCSGEPRTVRSVAELIQGIAGGGKLKFGAQPYRTEEAMKFFGSNEKYRRLFGSAAFTDFESAIRRTLEYQRAHAGNRS